MADLAQTPANVRAGSGAVTELAVAGEIFTAGCPVYQDSTSGKWYRADANDAAAYNASGIALTGAVADGNFVVQTKGQCVIGATTAAGIIYIASANPGKIAPAADLAAGWYPAIIGVGLNTTGTVDLFLRSGSVPRI
jgi:hypothetical protein